MREIQLTQGKVALVDDDDYAKVSPHKWAYCKGYALRRWGRKESGDGFSRCHLHRYLVGAEKGRDVDHVNGNGLDNRKENLRVCDRKQNGANTRKRSTKNRFKGTYFCKQANRWLCMARVNGKVKCLGRFSTDEGAARRYDDFAREHFGPFCCVNFPRPGERSAITGEVAPLAPVGVSELPCTG